MVAEFVPVVAFVLCVVSIITTLLKHQSIQQRMQHCTSATVQSTVFETEIDISSNLQHGQHGVATLHPGPVIASPPTTPTAQTTQMQPQAQMGQMQTPTMTQGQTGQTGQTQVPGETSTVVSETTRETTPEEVRSRPPCCSPAAVNGCIICLCIRCAASCLRAPALAAPAAVTAGPRAASGADVCVQTTCMLAGLQLAPWTLRSSVWSHRACACLSAEMHSPLMINLCAGGDAGTAIQVAGLQPGRLRPGEGLNNTRMVWCLLTLRCAPAWLWAALQRCMQCASAALPTDIHDPHVSVHCALGPPDIAADVLRRPAVS